MTTKKKFGAQREEIMRTALMKIAMMTSVEGAVGDEVIQIAATALRECGYEAETATDLKG